MDLQTTGHALTFVKIQTLFGLIWLITKINHKVSWKYVYFLVCGVGQIWFSALWSRWLRLRRQSRSSRNRQIAGLTCSWVEVSSSKTLNPKFLLMSSWHLACISVWTGEFDKCCEALWAVGRLDLPSLSLLHWSVWLEYLVMNEITKKEWYLIQMTLFQRRQWRWGDVQQGEPEWWRWTF